MLWTSGMRRKLRVLSVTPWNRLRGLSLAVLCVFPVGIKD